MTAITYHIVYKGEILDGYDFKNVRDQLVKTFSLSPKKAEQLLKSDRVVIKRNLDLIAAKKIGLALKRAGLKVVMVRDTPPKALEKPAPQNLMEKPHRMVSPENSGLNISEPEQQEKINKTALPIEFRGTGIEYFKIWIVNVILSILTLGIYSAWAKVRRKQYFYGSTRLQNSSFEYLADPVKILKGRIIVVIFFILFSIISKIHPLAANGISLLFLLILPWLVVRSLTFNAENSAYRNIRFGFNGTVKEAFKVFLLWPVLVPFTLGLLFPYVYFRQKKFMIENSSYGKSRFTFKAGPKDYYTVILIGLFPVFTGLAIIIVTNFFLTVAAGLLGMVFYLYLFAYFSANYMNLLYNSTKLSVHQFKADLIPIEYFVLVITNTLGMVFTLGIFYPWAQLRTIRYKLNHLKLISRGNLNNFIAQEQKQVSALGEEASDFFDIDIGL